MEKKNQKSMQIFHYLWKSECATSAFSQQVLSLKHSYHAFAISELDSPREESGSVSYRVGFLGEFEVAKRALKMAYTISDCSATTLLEFSAT